LPVTEKRYWGITKQDQYNNTILDDSVAAPSYTAVDQYRNIDRTGAMVVAWSDQDRFFIEDELFVLGHLNEAGDYKTGLFIFDAEDESYSDEKGNIHITSDILASSSETFVGSIGDIKADSNLVFAAKSGFDITKILSRGVPIYDETTNSSFSSRLENIIIQDWVNDDYTSGTGRIYQQEEGELLIFGHKNADGQFGFPYQLAGRIEV